MSSSSLNSPSIDIGNNEDLVIISYRLSPSQSRENHHEQAQEQNIMVDQDEISIISYKLASPRQDQDQKQQQEQEQRNAEMMRVDQIQFDALLQNRGDSANLEIVLAAVNRLPVTIYKQTVQTKHRFVALELVLVFYYDFYHDNKVDVLLFFVFGFFLVVLYVCLTLKLEKKLYYFLVCISFIL